MLISLFDSLFDNIYTLNYRVHIVLVFKSSRPAIASSYGSLLLLVYLLLYLIFHFLDNSTLSNALMLL